MSDTKEVLIEVAPIPETEEQRKARELAEIKTEFGILVENDQLDTV